MEIMTRREADVGVVGVEGHLTAGGPEGRLLETVTDLLEGECRCIVVDLSSVNYVDSAGLGCLVRCLQRCSDVDGEFRLAGVSSRLLSLLQLARLTDVFVIFDNVEAALGEGDG
jgi:anti-sigma B factor antagonist